VSPYKVMVDDNFHYQNEDERYELGTFLTAEEAIAACKRVVDEDLNNSYKPGDTGPELYERYTMFGEDPFIVPLDEADNTVKFSAWDYAKERSSVLANQANTPDGGTAVTLMGDGIYEQMKATRAMAKITRLRTDEPLLGTLTHDEQDWLTKAFSHLKRIDGERAKQRDQDEPYCIFAFSDNLFVQFLARSHSRRFVCEAVSAKFGLEIAKLLTSEREALLYGFGFEPVGVSPNYSQQIDVESDDDLGYAARLAFRVLKQVYQIEDFALGNFKLHVPGTEAPETKFRLTISEQPLILNLKSILSLFGKERVIDFADGKWTPFVFMEVDEGPIGPDAVAVETFSTAEGYQKILKTRPRYEIDFGGYIREQIEEIENAVPSKLRS
jgi:hypothetical protein